MPVEAYFFMTKQQGGMVWIGVVVVMRIKVPHGPNPEQASSLLFLNKLSLSALIAGLV